MKLKFNTLVLVAIALLMGLGVYLFEQRQAQQESAEQVAAAGTPLFKFKEDQVQALTVTTGSTTLSFERTQRSFPNTWLMLTPKKVPADEAAVAFLLSLITTGKSQETLTVPRDRRAEFGLEQPRATVEVTLKDKQRHRLVLGQLTFNQSAIYALADPVDGSSDLQVLLAPTELDSAVNRPVGEWEYRPQTGPSPSPSPDPN